MKWLKLQNCGKMNPEIGIKINFNYNEKYTQKVYVPLK